MKSAVRAIIIKDDQLLVMRRNKSGEEFFTLLGGRIEEGETPDQAVIREIKEESGIDIVSARLVFLEDHPEPYDKQFIFLCETKPNTEVALQADSGEAQLNKLQFSTYEPLWVGINGFSQLAFRTPQLQKAITDAIANGFPAQPVSL